MIDWSAARASMMLDPNVSNLNTGSFGPLSRVVFDRVTDLRKHLAAEPMDFLLRRQPAELWRARERMAVFLNISPRRLIFTTNVSAAINLVASSISISGPGDILLTDHEYGCMHWCWERVARRLNLNLRTFALPTRTEDPAEIIDAARKAMTPKTRLLFFSHVLSPTGLVLPAREICEEARRRGILTVIDGAHGPAFIPLDIATIPCDFYAANAHKWMLAPTGAGFLYFAPGTEDRLDAMHVSWGWHTPARDLDAPDEFGSTARIRRLEFEGTRDLCPWLSIPAAIDYQAEIGVENIQVRMRELSDHVRQRFAWMKLATPANPALSGAMTAFELPPGINPIELRKRIWEAKTEINVIERPDRLLFRLSTHFYNTHDEIDRFADQVPKMLENARSSSS